MKTLTLISCTLAIGTTLSACGADPIVLGELIAAAERGDTDPTEEREPTPDPEFAPEVDPIPASEPSREEAEEILLQYCGECHEAPADAGGLSVIGDVDALIEQGKIIPGDREDSPIYARMVSQMMPPMWISERPSPDEIEYIGLFIDSLE